MLSSFFKIFKLLVVWLSMKNEISRKEAFEKIKEFFEKKNFSSKEVKKIKKLAMSKNIQLLKYRKRFCKGCLSDLKNGKIRITRFYRSIECNGCKFKNRWKIKIS